MQDQVYNAIQDIAKRKKYDFVFDKSSDLVMLYFNKKHDGFFGKIVKGLVNSLKKYIWKTIKLVVILTLISWFNIQGLSFIKGLTRMASGELVDGFIMIVKGNPIKTFKEAMYVGLAKDYRWESYKQKTKIDLSKDFIYLGNRLSMTKNPIYVKDIAKGDCKGEECDEAATANSLEEAQNYCNKNYGAYVPLYEQIDDVFKRDSPFTTNRSDMANKYPELTSSTNPADRSQYRVFYKSERQFKNLIKHTVDGNGIYIEDDSEINTVSTFRCFINL